MDSRKVVQVQVRSAYGQDRVYPMNETARLLLKLIGGKIFAPRDLSVISELGYEIEYVARTVELPKSVEE